MEIFIRNAFSWEIRGKAERTFNYFPSRGKVPDALLENLGSWWTWVLCPLISSGIHPIYPPLAPYLTND